MEMVLSLFFCFVLFIVWVSEYVFYLNFLSLSSEAIKVDSANNSILSMLIPKR